MLSKTVKRTMKFLDFICHVIFSMIAPFRVQNFFSKENQDVDLVFNDEFTEWFIEPLGQRYINSQQTQKLRKYKVKEDALGAVLIDDFPARQMPVIPAEAFLGMLKVMIINHLLSPMKEGLKDDGRMNIFYVDVSMINKQLDEVAVYVNRIKSKNSWHIAGYKITPHLKATKGDIFFNLH